MKILVCNVGSTSLKFKLYNMPECQLLVQCKVERIGNAMDSIFQYKDFINCHALDLDNQNILDYKTGFKLFLDYLTDQEQGIITSLCEIDRVGYKATLSKNHYGVHELTNKVIDGMREWLVLAKIHNTAYLEVIKVTQDLLPTAALVGVFESGFHMDIPLERRLYGLPYEWYEKHGIQRLGYHGASHGFIADCLSKLGSKEYGAISCHLGGSSSICAIKDGKSIDTSFGMSLQSGLIHANRVGDMDCDLYEFLQHEGLSEDEIRDGFQKNGGLMGLSGISNDLRYIEEAAAKGNYRAKLSIDVFVSGILHYIGAFFIDLGKLDYLVFTGGIGENSQLIRNMVCERLNALGVNLDNKKNKTCHGYMELSDSSSKVRILVIPTDEEIGIAKRTYEFIR